MDNKFNKYLWLFGLMVIYIVIFFLIIDRRSLWEPDEVRCAEIAREMLISGDWITPRLNYVKYFEKPPLTYWLVALSFKLFGISVFSARLIPAICGIFVIISLFFLGQRMWNNTLISFFAGFCLATSILFLELSRVVLVDIILCLGITLAFLGAWALYQETFWGKYLFWGGCAIGFLTKGLLGLGLPLIVIIIYSILAKEHSELKKFFCLRGLTFFLLLCLPWLILISLINPEFPKFFFIEESLGRFLTTRHQRYQPFYFYLLVLPGAFFPWTIITPWALVKSWPNDNSWRSKQANPWLFTMVWLLSLLIFFSFSCSKMPHYALPILPALALIVSEPLSRLWKMKWHEKSPRGVRWGLIGLAYVFFFISLFLLIIPTLISYIKYTQISYILLFIPLYLASLALIIYLIQSRILGIWISYLVTILTFISLSSVFTSYLEDYRSLESLITPIKNELKLNDLLISYGDYYYGMVFYSGRRVAIVRNWGELEFGRRQDNEFFKWFIPNDTIFLYLLQNSRLRVVAIAETQSYQYIKKKTKAILGLKLFEWNHKGDKTLFSNRPCPQFLNFNVK